MALKNAVQVKTIFTCSFHFLRMSRLWYNSFCKSPPVCPLTMCTSYQITVTTVYLWSCKAGLKQQPGHFRSILLSTDKINSGMCFLVFHRSGEGPHAHLQKLAECIRWSYGAGIIFRLGNIARLELNYCIPMGVQSGDRYQHAHTEHSSL